MKLFNFFFVGLSFGIFFLNNILFFVLVVCIIVDDFKYVFSGVFLFVVGLSIV